MVTLSNWTDDRVELLKKLYEDGLSCAEIARDIGYVSRNGVIGKIHRLGLLPRAKRCIDPEELRAREEKRKIRMTEKQRERRGLERLQSKPAFEPVFVPSFVGSFNLPFGDLRPISAHDSNQCRYIEGPAPVYAACGNPTEPGCSWCSHHAAIVFLPSERRRATINSRPLIEVAA